MSDKNNVSVAKPAIGGAIFWAPLGTDLPTDAAAVLDEAFKSLGYCSEDGVKNEFSTDEEKKAWGKDTVLTTKTDTFKATLIEATNTEVLKLVYGSGNVTGDVDTGITIVANSVEQENCVLVVDMILKNDVLKRIVIPNARVSEVGEVPYTDDDLIGYETTILAEEHTSGNFHYEYIKKKVAA